MPRSKVKLISENYTQRKKRTVYLGFRHYLGKSGEMIISESLLATSEVNTSLMGPTIPQVR